MSGAPDAITTAHAGGGIWATGQEWVAYVDESGSRVGARGGPGRFVLACVAGSPEAIAGLAESVRRLKLELVPKIDPADWELHAGDMFHGRGGSPL